MTAKSLKQYDIPDAPGVYYFKKGKDILYVGRATSLRDRVKSYFTHDLIATRGLLIVDMVVEADSLSCQTTDSLLEALVLEANEIKKLQPHYNTKEKDNKSFNFVCITNEDFPRVLTIRGRELEQEKASGNPSKYKYVFGPYPQGSVLGEAMRIVRKIFPFRDRCEVGSGKPCFNRQLGLCPGVCTGEISQGVYQENIRHIALIFQGKKTSLLKELHKEMMRHAREQAFEIAEEIKREIFALEHINDISMVKEEINLEKEVVDGKSGIPRPVRIEAYDIAHISGPGTVGAMTAWQESGLKKSAYKKFRIKSDTKGSDTDALRELLKRRFAHPEWGMPDIIVYDGSLAQRNVVFEILEGLSLEKLPEAVGVVKDARHRPSRLQGRGELLKDYKKQIIQTNAEAHRFAQAYHKLLRKKRMK